jgi:predicted transcriptional regulator
VSKVIVTKEEYEIAKKNGISERTVRYRIQNGYSKNLAITVPIYKRLLRV